VYEKVPGSNEWWVRWTDSEGKLRRQKVGRKSAAVTAYRKHKEEARAGVIVPELRNGNRVTVANLVDLALAHADAHSKDVRNYYSRGAIIKAEIGDKIADALKPSEIQDWLLTRKAATSNRYKALLSLAYRLGLANGKVQSNPVRNVRQRKESSGRLRFLSKDEYAALSAAIQETSPHKLADFIVSVHSGMRLSEQYTTEWPQVDLTRRTIRLTDTKNGSARTVYLDADAVAALESIQPKGKATGTVFTSEQADHSTKEWFVPALAKAKITGYTWHCNRHTFCSWLAMSGASIKEIQELAGHKTVAMSARYAHLSPDHKLSVLENLARFASTDTKGANCHHY
jgi:integrase